MATACDKIFKKIDELFDDYVGVWEDVCNIESPSSCKAGVDAVGNYFASLAEERGFKVERLSQEVSGDLICITLNPDSDKRPLTLSAHMDTVHPIGSFGTPAVRRDEEKIYGPGVMDCKGGAVAAFLAMDALYQCGFTTRPVRLLLQSDEEVGSRTSKRETINYMCESSKDSIAFLNLEGCTPGEACLIRKGIVTFTFKVTGKEAHSSNCATIGASAILEAAHKIIELEKIKDDDGLTCNCGVIKGGTVTNTVPGYCEFKANVRYATKEQFDYICEYMQKVADTVYVKGCTTSVSHSKGRIAMVLTERNAALLDTVNGIFEANGLSALKLAKRKGGSDAAEVTEYGIPCIDSLGVAGGLIHSRNEYAILSSLAESAKRLAAVAWGIQD